MIDLFSMTPMFASMPPELQASMRVVFVLATTIQVSGLALLSTLVAIHVRNALNGHNRRLSVIAAALSITLLLAVIGLAWAFVAAAQLAMRLSGMVT